MKYEELHEVIKWTLKGIGKLFMIKTPKASEIQIVSYKAFVSADATNDNNIDFTELVNWIELNMKFINFLQEFEPTQPIVYDKKVFQQFHKIDVNNFELDSLVILIDSNRLVKALTESLRQRNKSPYNKTRTEDNEATNVYKRQIFKSSKNDLLAILQINESKKLKMIKDNSKRFLHPQVKSPEFKQSKNFATLNNSPTRSTQIPSLTLSPTQTKEFTVNLNFTPIHKRKISLITPQQTQFPSRQQTFLQEKQVQTARVSPRRQSQSNFKAKKFDQTMAEHIFQTSGEEFYWKKQAAAEGELRRKQSMAIKEQSNLQQLEANLIEEFNSASNKRREFFHKNFISLRGRSYSKKSLKQMKEYFDAIDFDKKGYITIDDYVKTCQNHSSLKLISISLFKYFDKKSCGSITFIDMIKAMIPGLQKEHIDKIVEWVKLDNIKYNELDDELRKPDAKSPRDGDDNLSEAKNRNSSQDQTFNQANSSQQQSKKSSRRQSTHNPNLKFISTEEITEYRNIFDLFDKKKKGVLEREQFLFNLSTLYSYSDCVLKLKMNGLENAKEIRIDQFIQMLKPYNTVIPELVLKNLRQVYNQKYNQRISSPEHKSRLSDNNLNFLK